MYRIYAIDFNAFLVSVTAGMVDVKVVKMFAARYLEDGSGKGNT